MKTETLFPEEMVKPKTLEVSLDSLPNDDMLVGPVATGDLIDSIKQFGILQPVILIESKTGKYRVADGRRRVKAARAADLKKIRAEVYPDKYVMQEVIAIVGNNQRSQNYASDLISIEKLMKRGATEDQICEATGMPKQTLQKRMRLLSLIPEMREAMNEGNMKRAISEMVSRLIPAKQKSLLKVLGKNGKIRAQDVREMLQATALDANKLSPELFNGPSAPKGATDLLRALIDSPELMDVKGETRKLVDEARSILGDKPVGKTLCEVFAKEDIGEVKPKLTRADVLGSAHPF